MAGIAARDPVRLTPASAAYRPSRAITQHTLDAGSRLDSTARGAPAAARPLRQPARRARPPEDKTVTLIHMLRPEHRN